MYVFFLSKYNRMQKEKQTQKITNNVRLRFNYRVKNLIQIKPNLLRIIDQNRNCISSTTTPLSGTIIVYTEAMSYVPSRNTNTNCF